jgi:hypothetical protein
MSDHDEAGPGRPPRGRPFAPGRSGNPSGRPKGSISLASVMQKVMREPTRCTEDGKPITVPRLEGICKKISVMALGGDLAAARLCLDYMGKLEPVGSELASGTDTAKLRALIAEHERDVLARHARTQENDDGG